MIFRTTDQTCFCRNTRLPTETCPLYPRGDNTSVNYARNFC